MIGLLIGMIAVVVMMQVFSTSEGFKRTTTGGADAQTAGAIALYSLQRDLRQSGHGMNALPIVGCNLQLRGGVTLNQMAPVTINHADIPAGDANTDTLLITYSNTNGAPEGDRVSAQPAANIFTMTTPGAFRVNDHVVVIPTPRPASCTLTLTTVSAVTGLNVTVAGSGTAGVVGGQLYSLGTQPRVIAYAIRNGDLTRCDFMAEDCRATASVADRAIWVPIASNVVSLRAQYGHDTTPAVNGSADYFDAATPTTRCGWARVNSLRVALTARSSQFEKETVTTAAPQWASTASAVNADLRTIDVSGNANWQNYRYRVFETTSPLKNMSWLNTSSDVQSTCTSWPAAAV